MLCYEAVRKVPASQAERGADMRRLEFYIRELMDRLDRDWHEAGAADDISGQAAISRKWEKAEEALALLREASEFREWRP